MGGNRTMTQKEKKEKVKELIALGYMAIANINIKKEKLL